MINNFDFQSNIIKPKKYIPILAIGKQKKIKQDNEKMINGNDFRLN